MASLNPVLALSYIETHPDAAARVLESLQPSATAGFLKSLDAEHVAAIVPRVLPHYSSKLAAELENKQLGDLFTSLDISYIAAVLRYLPRKRRDAILGHLPTTKRTACQLLLTFSQDAVGSWMTPNVVALPEDCNVKTAREHIKSSEEEAPSEKLFVVNRDRQIIGNVSNLDITRSSKETAITELLTTDSHALLARMSIKNAAQNKSWAKTDVMPVINRSQQFIGIIKHVDLRHGLDRIESKPEPAHGDNPLAGLFEAYGTTLITLAGALEDIVVGPDEEQRR